MTLKDRDSAGSAARNPRIFTFTFSPEASRIGGVKVRLEFWVSAQSPHYRTEPRTLLIPATRTLEVRLNPARAYSAIADLQRWLHGANLADAVLGAMVDQTVQALHGIADQINADISQGKPDGTGRAGAYG